MRIYEIPPKSKVTIRAVRKENQFEIEGTVAGVRGTKVFLKLLKYQGQIINFESKNVQLFAFYVNNDVEPLGWSGVTIKRMTLGHSKYHVLICNKSSVRINRRGARRVNVDIEGNVAVKSHDYKLEAKIVDVSLSGIAFTTTEDIHDIDFAPVIVALADPDIGVITTTCAIMRRIPTGDENVFRFGAIIPKPSESWLRFVNKIYKDNPEGPK